MVTPCMDYTLHVGLRNENGIEDNNVELGYQILPKKLVHKIKVPSLKHEYNI